MSLIFIFGCVTQNYVEIDGEKIIVELARTNQERQQGLMFRDQLCENCGMLFIFDNERSLSFWMKNTLIPLDMVFINSNLEIVDILHAVPCSEDPCKSYVPQENAAYVLETNVNKFDESIIGKKVNMVLK